MTNNLTPIPPVDEFTIIRISYGLAFVLLGGGTRVIIFVSCFFELFGQYFYSSSPWVFGSLELLGARGQVVTSGITYLWLFGVETMTSLSITVSNCRRREQKTSTLFLTLETD
ncbi:hypothetical protein TorRG33x02_300230 [Trema orientale]|uniref:Uncharacterized protein n=1 Tax=Trema orientale TaxID=63057 RepID=A0A2P5C2B0_TREOI|nr:hypothetical protein TorRG33x02_300230 [Trema orientale]